jgi:hypothetical protein
MATVARLECWSYTFDAPRQPARDHVGLGGPSLKELEDRPPQTLPGARVRGSARTSNYSSFLQRQVADKLVSLLGVGLAWPIPSGSAAIRASAGLSTASAAACSACPPPLSSLFASKYKIDPIAGPLVHLRAQQGPLLDIDNVWHIPGHDRQTV